MTTAPAVSFTCSRGNLSTEWLLAVKPSAYSILSGVVIGGVVALFLFPTDRVVWILPASRLTRSPPADPATSQEQPPLKDYS